MSNSGIQITGGSVTAQQLVAGTNARAILTQYNDPHFQKALEKLEHSISQSGLDEDKIWELMISASAIRQEVLQAKPQKSKVEQWLQIIEKSAGSVSAVGAAAKVIMSLLAT